MNRWDYLLTALLLTSMLALSLIIEATTVGHPVWLRHLLLGM